MRVQGVLSGRNAARACTPRTLGQKRPNRLQVIAGSSKKVPFTIQVNEKVAFGEAMKAVGNNPIFGDWDVGRGLLMQWQDGDVWAVTIDIPVGQPLSFKLVKANGDSASEWEGGNDRQLTALGPDYGLKMSCKWNSTEGASIVSFKLDSNGAEGSSGAVKEVSSPSEASKPAASSAPQASKPREDRGSSAWVGDAPKFVTSKHENGQPKRSWNAEGLTGTALALVEGDQKSSNWLSKLGLVKSLLVDRAPKKRPGVEEMAASYVYTTWINTGAILCGEGGGHHRPNHHAMLSMEMFRSLEWVIGDASAYYSSKPADASSGSASSVMAARRMHSRLPSFSGEFRQSVPLTRIRDIAHRNDIPHDVKNEIKHTLQNKLHRCAGPEDLIAAEAMLVRLTSDPGQFNQDFVGEFQLFMKELREFFNATGLEDLLHKTRDSMDESHQSALTQMLNAKTKVGNNENADIEDLMSLLSATTQVRTFYISGLSAGMRNDTNEELLEMRQRWRLADVRLEEYSFVVLSRLINSLEKLGGAEPLSKAGNQAWSLPLSALTAGLRNLGLSQFRQRELLMLENELQAWHTASPLASSGKDNALRAKASLDRVLRLAGEYSDSIMQMYSTPAADLGKGLGLPEHMSSIFGESEVRASIAFQVSKLASLMSKALRMAAGQSAWDGLVSGEAVGELQEVDSLCPSAVDAVVAARKDKAGTGFVLVVGSAEGDEELGPLVPLGLRGVVLRQELPHLSHLGVRARQEKVTFATLDDREQYDQMVKPLIGKCVRLEVLPGGVTLVEASQEQQAKGQAVASPSAADAKAPEGSWSAAKKCSAPTLVPLTEAVDGTCGAKSAKCADLGRLAADSKGLFSTPRGCCLPFGTMDLAIAAGGADTGAAVKAALAELERADLTGDALDAACVNMQQLIAKLDVPGDLLKQMSAVFEGGPVLLAVRSSANVEDLAGMSAAGLYESVVGVKSEDAEAVRAAVAAVWASLYTRRAVLSRRTVGVPQHAATMAVLIQELFCPKVSFVLHTARPSDGNANVVLVEAAPGQGETLAAATAGTPWRFEVDKTSGKVDTLAFANFSRALQLVPSQGLMEVDVDYSKQRVSVDAEYRNQVAQRLAAAGTAIEAYFDGVPQDIEGGLVTDAADELSELFIFQTRPQH